jgi:hypothetical protein
MTHWTDALVKLKACHDAVEWASTQPDLATAWRECKRGDWMLWLLGKLEHSDPWSEGRKRFVRCAVECAAEAEPYEGSGATGRMAARCRRAVLAWTRGEATSEDVINAQDAAWAAANAASYAAADAACVYAVDAADAAATAAADAAYDAAYAASDAAYAADEKHDVDVRYRILARCADIVRSHYPDPPAIKGGDR